MALLIRRVPPANQATPNDTLTYFGPPDRSAAANEVRASVTFTHDKPCAVQLAEQWRVVEEGANVIAFSART